MSACLPAILGPAPPTKPSTLRRAEAAIASVPARADLVLLGDSLAAGWPRELWADFDPDLAVFNFGVPGERFQNTLWRLSVAATAHLRPRWCILLLGTNNLSDGDAPETIAAGLREVARVVADLWLGPATLVMTIPWRPASAAEEADRRRANALLAKDLTLTVLDADAALGSAEHVAPDAFEPDRIHIAPVGYAILAPRCRAALGIIHRSPHAR